MPVITHYINVSRQHFVHPKLTGMLCVNYTSTIKKIMQAMAWEILGVFFFLSFVLTKI